MVILVNKGMILEGSIGNERQVHPWNSTVMTALLVNS